MIQVHLEKTHGQCGLWSCAGIRVYSEKDRESHTSQKADNQQ